MFDSLLSLTQVLGLEPFAQWKVEVLTLSFLKNGWGNRLDPAILNRNDPTPMKRC
jgi:hypothetical protein